MENPTVLGGKTNVLGLAFFVAWTLLFMAIVYFVGPFPTIRRQALTMSMGIILMVPDLVFRYRQPTELSYWRFISDIHGGAVAYVPAWAWMPLVSTIASFAWLSEK